MASMKKLVSDAIQTKRAVIPSSITSLPVIYIKNATMYRNVIRPVGVYGCEGWSLTHSLSLSLSPPGATQPIVGVYFTALYRALASSRTRLLDHTQRRATVGRTPLNE